LREVKFAALGFLAAAAIPPVVLAIMSPLGDKLSIASAAGTMVVVFPFSAVAVLALGLPVFLLLRRFRPGTWWSVLIVGFLLGVPVAIAVRGHLYLRDLLIDAPLAAASALVFWLIWKRGADLESRKTPAPRPLRPGLG
jgi:hypothetical protein